MVTFSSETKLTHLFLFLLLLSETSESAGHLIHANDSPGGWRGLRRPLPGGGVPRGGVCVCGGASVPAPSPPGTSLPATAAELGFLPPGPGFWGPGLPHGRAARAWRGCGVGEGRAGEQAWKQCPPLRAPHNCQNLGAPKTPFGGGGWTNTARADHADSALRGKELSDHEKAREPRKCTWPRGRRWREGCGRRGSAGRVGRGGARGLLGGETPGGPWGGGLHGWMRVRVCLSHGLCRTSAT